MKTYSLSTLLLDILGRLFVLGGDDDEDAIFKED